MTLERAVPSPLHPSSCEEPTLRAPSGAAHGHNQRTKHKPHLLTVCLMGELTLVWHNFSSELPLIRNES